MAKTDLKGLMIWIYDIFSYWIDRMKISKKKGLIAVAGVILYFTVGQVIGVWLIGWAMQSINHSIQIMTGG